MTDSRLRGRCYELASRAVDEDPTLTLVRGWYDDPIWGAEEHWWCARPDGTIVDPTSAQFHVGGVTEWYRPFGGLYPCAECGREVPEDRLVGDRCCSGECFGRMVGIPVRRAGVSGD